MVGIIHDRVDRRGFEAELSYLGMMDSKASVAFDSSSTLDCKAHVDKLSFYSCDLQTSFFRTRGVVLKVNLNYFLIHLIIDQI